MIKSVCFRTEIVQLALFALEYDNQETDNERFHQREHFVEFIAKYACLYIYAFIFVNMCTERWGLQESFTYYSEPYYCSHVYISIYGAVVLI